MKVPDLVKRLEALEAQCATDRERIGKLEAERCLGRIRRDEQAWAREVQRNAAAQAEESKAREFEAWLEANPARARVEVIPRYTETTRVLSPGIRIDDETAAALQELGADVRRDQAGSKLAPVELHRDGRLIEFSDAFWRRVSLDAALKHALDEGAITVRDLTEGEIMVIERRAFEERRHMNFHKMHESTSA